MWEYDSGSIVVFVAVLPQEWSSIWKAAADGWRSSQNIPCVFSREPRLNPAQRRHKTSACLPGATYTHTGKDPQEPFLLSVCVWHCVSAVWQQNGESSNFVTQPQACTEATASFIYFLSSLVCFITITSCNQIKDIGSDFLQWKHCREGLYDSYINSFPCRVNNLVVNKVMNLIKGRL